MRIIHEGIASYEDERPAHLSDLPEDFHDARTHGKLKLDVVPDAVSGSLANAKELASLSGGEKSFGTTAMLLSQWADIEAPFHCLDEFVGLPVSSNRANADVALTGCLYGRCSPAPVRHTLRR